MSAVEIENVGVPTTRQARRTAAGPLLFLGSLTLLGAGALIALGPRILPASQRWADMLTDQGARTGPLLVAGSVLFGLAMLCRWLRLLAGRILERGESEMMLGGLTAAVADLKADLADMREKQRHVYEHVGRVWRETHEHREETKVNGHKDALFRLAASLDQVGVRIETCIASSTSTVQASIYEVGSAVEASRDYIHDMLHDMTHEFADPASESEVQHGAGSEGEYAADVQLEAAVPDPGSNNYQVCDHDELHVLADDEFEIHVEFEEEIEFVKDHLEVSSGLGLLDEIDDAPHTFGAEPQQEQLLEPPSLLPDPPSVAHTEESPSAEECSLPKLNLRDPNPPQHPAGPGA